jgi:amino acid adenylation domain-containing protein
MADALATEATPHLDWLIRDWNATDRPYPKDLVLHQLLERQVAAKGDAIAVACGDQALSYAALGRRADRWAGRLRQLGIGPDRLVGVHLGRTPELPAVLLGILKAGGAYLPLDPAYPPERLQFISSDAGMTALITSQPEAWPELDPRVSMLVPGAADRDDSPAAGSPGAAPAARPGHLAYVLYTSGSTGQPKGIALTHANAVDLLHWAAEVFGDDLDRVLAATSICFDCSILEIFGPLSWGGTVVLADSPADIGARVDGSQVRLLHTVPSIVDSLLRTERLPGTVRTAIVGGEVLGPAAAARLYERSSIERLVNLYGPAEVTSYATMSVVARRASAAPSIGRPVANTRIYVLDSLGNPAPPGESGEIFIAGDGLARGYLRRPRLTAECFVPEPFSGRSGARMYRTGDLGHHDEHGELRFAGRIDDQVKVRGVRVEPEEVEQALLGHDGVREAAVAVRGSGAALMAYLVPARADSIRPEDLRGYLQGKLPRALIPDAFIFMAELPRLPNGKIDRRQLPEAGGGPGPCAAAAVPAGTAWESLLAQLWAAAVNADAIDVRADLFGLGSHSLAALRVKAALSGLLGADVPTRLFFQPTIAGLAAELERRLGPTPPVLSAAAGETRWPPPAPDRGALSLMQQAILRRADLEADAAGLHFPMAVRLSGRLSHAGLAQAVAAVVRRHWILGAIVGPATAGPGRFAAAPARQPTAGHASRRMLPLVDLTSVGPRLRAGVAQAAAAAVLDRPVQVRAEPPLRVRLLRLADDEHVLLINLHHIAGDAWSVATLSHQILALYSAAIHGQPVAMPPVAQYADWAAAQQQRLDSAAGQAQGSYWRDRLRDLPVLRLPGDARRAQAVSAITSDFAEIPAETVAALGALGREEGATPYMVLTAGFAALLHSWSGQTDIVIGNPLAGRIRSELASVIGPCQEALPLRCDLSGEPSFRQLVRHVRDRTLEAYANSDVPFVILSERRPADVTRHPVFQSSIVYQQPPSLLDPQYRERLFAREDIGDLRTLPFREAQPGSTALDVEMMLFERDDEIEIELDCRSDVVPADDVRRMTQDFPAILRAGAAQPEQRLSGLLAGTSR